MKSSFQKITPRKAAAMLAKNGRNRRISRPAVERYARDMATGKWVENGEPVIVSSTGQLLDGQHRLSAVVQSGESVRMLVVHGVEDCAFSTIDSGNSRTFQNVLGMRGDAHSSHLAGAVRLLWLYRKGCLGGGDTVRPRGGKSYPRASHSELLECLDREPGIVDSVEFARDGWHKILSASNASFCHYVFSEQDPQKAADFIDHLRSGAGLGKTSVILLLRNRLISNMQDTTKLNRESILYYCFRTWIAYRDGRRLKKLMLPKNCKVPRLPDLGAAWPARA